MNPLSHGTVTLRSSNPSDSPIIDPNLFSHPFDRRVAIEGMKTLMKLFQAPALAPSAIKVVAGPKSNSDEDVWVSRSPDPEYMWLIAM